MPIKRKPTRRQRRAPRRYTPTSAGTSTSAPEANDLPPVQHTPGSSWRITPGRAQASAGSRPGRAIRDLERRLEELENSISTPSQPAVETHRSPNGRQNLGEYVISSFALPLHASVEREAMEKILQGEYIDLGSINPTRQPDPRKTERGPLSITAWARAFIRMMSVLVEHDQVNPQDMLIHLDNVLALSQDRHQWESYDTEFRRQQVNAGYSFAQTRVELYAKAVTRAPAPRYQPPFQQARKFQLGTGFQPGTCYRYHTPGQRCELQSCQYAHKCPHCGARHPQYMCYKTKGGQQQSKEPAEKREDKGPK